MKIVILDALTFGETSLDSLSALGEVTTFQTTAPYETLSRIKDANVVITNKVVITAEMMDLCSALELICIAATGMNNVDLDAAKIKNIEVKNVVAYSTDSVVQHTFSMLFYLIAHSSYYDNYVKDGSWSRSPIFTDVSQPFFEIKDKKWGIIGLGAIGQGVASVASSFGAEVYYFSTSGKNNNAEYKQVDLETLLKECDIITVHAPLNEATNNLLDYEKLSLLKERAVLLNLGRGGIVNEEDIAHILDEREIFVGLDVLAKEPMIQNHPLLSVKRKENLYITPHIAWTSIEARDKLIEGVKQNIEEHYA